MMAYPSICLRSAMMYMDLVGGMAMRCARRSSSEGVVDTGFRSEVPLHVLSSAIVLYM